ncbi:MAG: hypothetical protein ACRDP6_05050 [Actinoallomurus sp.]
MGDVLLRHLPYRRRWKVLDEGTRVVTRVRKVAAVSLMAPMAAAALAAGLSQPADAAEACPPLASASITVPQGTVRPGSSVHVSAQVNGLMLLLAHLQISGPGLDEQVGDSVMTGPISGDVTVPKAGDFTLAVIGNGTKCAYQTAVLSVRARGSAAKPTQGSTPGKTLQPGGGSRGSAGGASPLPGGTMGGGSTGVNNYPLSPLNGASPFSLPPVGPDGAAQGFQYPSPDPQVASPPSQPVARNVTETTPVKWGQSLAIALVLLVISAHLGMWSRRQRLAVEGPRSTSGGSGRWAGRKNARKSTSAMAATATAQADMATAQVDTAVGTTRIAGTAGAARTTGMFGTDEVVSADDTSVAAASSAADGAGAANRMGTADGLSDGAKNSGGRGYHGRRRRR